MSTIAATPTFDAAQIERMRTQFAHLGKDVDGFAFDFYTRLFELAPQVRPLFSSDVAPQGRKLATTLGLLVASLNNPERLKGPLSQLGHKHRGYGAQAGHFAVVGQALLETLSKRLGDDFDAESAGNWARAYQTAAGMMQAGMQ